MISKLSTREMVLIPIFSALIAIGAQLSIPIGPVPISLQSLFLMIGAYYLSPNSTFISGIIYLILGLIGIPVFAGGMGGIGSILRPSFGFLIAMPIAGFVMSKLMKGYNTSFTQYIGIYALGSFILYLIGLPYMAMILNLYLNKGMGMYSILKAGMLIFLPGDIIKSIVATMISLQLDKILK